MIPSVSEFCSSIEFSSIFRAHARIHVAFRCSAPAISGVPPERRSEDRAGLPRLPDRQELVDVCVDGGQDPPGRGLASARACHGWRSHQPGGRVPLQEEKASVRGDCAGQDPGARVGGVTGGVVVFIREEGAPPIVPGRFPAVPPSHEEGGVSSEFRNFCLLGAGLSLAECLTKFLRCWMLELGHIGDEPFIFRPFHACYYGTTLSFVDQLVFSQ